MTYLVIDTNIVLLDHTNIQTLGSKPDTVIVIPETTLDELDSKKSEPGELGYQARAFGRYLASGTRDTIIRSNNLTIAPINVGNVKIQIVSSTAYPNFSDTHTSVINDRKIINIAKQYQSSLNADVVFYTNDLMCGLRAEAEGIPTSDIKLVDDINPEFICTVDVSPEQFSMLDGSNILDIHPEHAPEHYNYIFNSVELGYYKLATIRANGLIDVIGKKQETDLRRQDINPMNPGQLFLSAAIQDPTIDLVIAEAPAGTGKTATAISNAMKIVRQNNQFESITYVRASVDDLEQIEQIGFLPGSAEEKNQVYLHPLYDTLDFIARTRFTNSKLKGEEYEKFIASKVEEVQSYYNIQAMTGLGMRGRTFNSTIAIIDEVQNQSQASLQKMLTRFGKNCKIIVIGSNRQIDNAYITKYNNGLSVLLDQATKLQSTIRIHAVPLTKIVRSPMAEWAENIFSQ